MPGTYEQRIKKSVEDYQGDLKKSRKLKERDKAARKEKRAFDKLPEQSKHDFWCNRCQIDFVAPAYKVWTEYYDTGCWHSFCPQCEQLVYRYISSKKLDPYYQQSLKVKYMASKEVKDFLQPSQYGFRTMYGDPYEALYKRFQQREEDMHNKYAALGLHGKTLKQKTEEEHAREALME